MKISTKGRYAVRMLHEIAADGNQRCLTLKELAERMQVSVKYLEQIATTLSKSGVLDTVKGHGGGYRIHGTPADYTVYDILVLVEDSMVPVACLAVGADTCPRQERCVTLPVWQGLDRVIREYLSGITIADL